MQYFVHAQGSEHHEHASLEALFTFVARDPSSLKSMEINPLIPSTDTEQTWFQEREALAQRRKAAREAAKQSSGDFCRREQPCMHFWDQTGPSFKSAAVPEV